MNKPNWNEWSKIIESFKKQPDISYHKLARDLGVLETSFRLKLLRMVDKGYLRREVINGRVFWKVMKEVNNG
jgi:predicted DNA-binding transcriptional regulator